MVCRAPHVPLFAFAVSLGCPLPDDDPQGDATDTATPVERGEEPTSLDPEPTTTAALQLVPPIDLMECGDGEIDSGEDCDHGDGNADDAACTTSCQNAVCGDGLVHAGVEQCDHGDGNADDAACTTSCRTAECGDGLLHAGVEQCDHGLLNGDVYGGCLPTCTWGPRCGDMILQADQEECDLGPEGGDPPDAIPCDAQCQHAARIVFVTGEVFGADLGGLDGADLKCRLAAKAAGLHDWDSFRAWLSDDTGSPWTRFDHGPDTVGVPYVLLNGLRLADDFDHLIEAGPLRGIDVTETLAVLDPQKPAWTNTSFTGAVFDPDAHCQRWSSTSPELPTARIGMASPLPADLLKWQDQRAYTTWDNASCTHHWRLYCFEQ